LHLVGDLFELKGSFFLQRTAMGCMCQLGYHIGIRNA